MSIAECARRSGHERKCPPAVLSEHSWGSSGYETGTADVSVHLPARHLRVEVVSASTFPVSLGGAEWELEVVGKSGALS